MASEQVSTGKLYAALISRLENDKAELERERNFLKKELAIQAYRNRKLEKEIEELKQDRQQTAPTRLPKPRTANVKRPVELADSDSDCSESTTTTTDTELERTPAPSSRPSPEMRPVTTPQTVLPSWMAIAEETIPKRANSSHEITAPQPHSLEKVHENGNNDDVITNSRDYWEDWINPACYALYNKGNLVELPGGIKTAVMTCRNGIKIRLIKAGPDHDIYRSGLIWLRYGCRLLCVCNKCSGGIDSVNKRFKIVGDELHLEETGAGYDIGLVIEAEKEL